MTWLMLKAIPWLKLYWKWLIFPVGIVLFLIGYLFNKRPNVLAPESVVAAKVEQKADEKAKTELAQAATEKAKELADIEKTHAETIAKLNIDQKAEVEKLREDPKKLNEFLINVGKSIRG